MAAEKAAFETSAEASTSMPEHLVASILSAARIPHEQRDAADASSPKDTAE
jgi:hypothetical protein